MQRTGGLENFPLSKAGGHSSLGMVDAEIRVQLKAGLSCGKGAGKEGGNLAGGDEMDEYL